MKIKIKTKIKSESRNAIGFFIVGQRDALPSEMMCHVASSPEARLFFGRGQIMIIPLDPNNTEQARSDLRMNNLYLWVWMDELIRQKEKRERKD